MNNKARPIKATHIFGLLPMAGIVLKFGCNQSVGERRTCMEMTAAEIDVESERTIGRSCIEVEVGRK